MKKSKTSAGSLLINCGSVTRETKGLPFGFFSEAAFAPFNRRLF